MMKNYFIALITLLAMSSFGQSYVYEDFSSSQMPPEGWTIEGFEPNWSVSNTSTAGGIAPEGKFTYATATSITRFISPVSDLTGLESVALSFAHFYDDYTGAGPKLGVATRSGGGDWNIFWEIDPVSNVGPETIVLEIDNEDVGSDDFQFCFYIEGNFYNMDYWFVDNILLYTELNLDGALLGITTPNYVEGTAEVTGILKNTIGLTQINSAEISWQVNNGEVHTTLFEGLELDMGDSYEFTSDAIFDFPIGVYDLNVWIATINGVVDEYQGNDMRIKNITVVSSSDDRKPCLEEFTSSTCAPCASFNTSFVPWCETHADDITLIKYQMSWPSPGDPYYTEEGGVRRQYYGVNAVPNLFGDGTSVSTSIGAVNTFFNNSLNTPSFARIASSHSISGTEISFETSVLAYAGFNNYRVHIIVFENVTTQNTGNNGETEFHHVMMKMIPDANGNVVDIEDRVPQTFTGTVDLAGTNVEEWDDLGVIVIMQDYASKFIQQSAYSVEDAVYATDDNLFILLVNDVAVDGFSSELLEYDVLLPEGTTEVPEVTGIPVDENAKLVVVPATELPGSTIVDVFAEDLKTYKRYTVNFELAVGIDLPQADFVNVYPNPSQGMFTLKGASGAKVLVTDLNGKVVYSAEDFTGTTLDLSLLENGIYLLSAQLADQSVCTKKLTILR